MSILQKVKKAAGKYRETIKKEREERTELGKQVREAYRKAYAKERIKQATIAGTRRAKPQPAVQVVKPSSRASPLQTFVSGEFKLPSFQVPNGTKIKANGKVKRKKRKKKTKRRKKKK